MKQSLNFLIFYIMLLLLFSCKTTVPKQNKNSIETENDIYDLNWYWHNPETDKLYVVNKAEYYSEAILKARIKDGSDGKIATLKVYSNFSSDEEDYLHKEFIEVKDNTIETKWVVEDSLCHVKHLKKGDTLKFYFTIEMDNLKQTSPEIEMIFTYYIEFTVSLTEVKKNLHKFYLESHDGSYKQKFEIKDAIVTDDERVFLRFTDLKPALTYKFFAVDPVTKFKSEVFSGVDFLSIVGCADDAKQK